jgi:hypothetical protein
MTKNTRRAQQWQFATKLPRPRPKTGQDPFGLLSLDEDPNFNVRLGDDLKRDIRNFARQRGVNADAVRIAPVVDGHPDVTVTLWEEIEWAIRTSRLMAEFRRRFPAAARAQIETDLTKRQKAYSELVRPSAYDLDTEGILPVLRTRLERIDTTLHALKHVMASLPTMAAPKGEIPAEGYQKVHQELSQNPIRWLIFRMRQIYEQAFERKAGPSDIGPAAEFIRLVINSPLVNANIESLRTYLDKPRPPRRAQNKLQQGRKRARR